MYQIRSNRFAILFRTKTFSKSNAFFHIQCMSLRKINRQEKCRRMKRLRHCRTSIKIITNKMSAYKRVQQWATFARVWHIYDAKWQNPFDSALVINKYLQGMHKPIYHPISNCGDHVVVFNCKHIALPGDEWKKRVYFHHTGYPGGASWTMAWELHGRDPTMIMKKAVYNSMPGNLERRRIMQRLHLYDEENIPEDILSNVSSQIQQLRLVPKKLESYKPEEVIQFPKLTDYPDDYVCK